MKKPADCARMSCICARTQEICARAYNNYAYQGLAVDRGQIAEAIDDLLHTGSLFAEKKFWGGGVGGDSYHWAQL